MTALNTLVQNPLYFPAQSGAHGRDSGKGVKAHHHNEAWSVLEEDVSGHGDRRPRRAPTDTGVPG